MLNLEKNMTLREKEICAAAIGMEEAKVSYERHYRTLVELTRGDDSDDDVVDVTKSINDFRSIAITASNPWRL